MRQRLYELQELGFNHASIDYVPIFKAGHRNSQAMLDRLHEIHHVFTKELDTKTTP